MEKLEWSILEYEEKQRSVDWFWALGVIVIAGSIASIIYANYFFAMILIIGGLLLGYFAIKKPEMIPYELNEKGFKIKNRLYPYGLIKSFWVQIETPDQKKEIKPTLFLKSSRQFMPVLSIPLTDASMAEKVKRIMIIKNVKQELMREHPSTKIMESLGF